jgi:hypothetical protein
LTVIVILALVALFIGLRLYSVLGERTGHEQQPILKPADPEAVVEPRVNRPSVVQPSATDPGDLAYLPTAGPGVRALLATDPAFDVARFLEGAKSAYRMVLEAYWKGDAAGLRPYVDDHVFETFDTAIKQREKDGLVLDNRQFNLLFFSACVFINNKKTEQWSSNPVPIVLEPDVISAIITGNEFYGKSRITNKSKGRTIIKDNIEQTEEDPFPAKKAK